MFVLSNRTSVPNFLTRLEIIDGIFLEKRKLPNYVKWPVFFLTNLTKRPRIAHDRIVCTQHIAA